MIAGVGAKFGGLTPGIPPLTLKPPLGLHTGLLPLPMFAVLSICRFGTTELAGHRYCWKFGVATKRPLLPGRASTTMRNVPPFPEKICGVGPGTYGVGVGQPEQSHPGLAQYTQPSLVARPK
jgi:hypothetical protein